MCRPGRSLSTLHPQKHKHTHLFGNGWFNTDWDNSSNDAAIEGRDKGGSLIWSKHQGHSITRLHRSPSSKLSKHKMSHLLSPTSQFSCAVYVSCESVWVCIVCMYSITFMCVCMCVCVCARVCVCVVKHHICLFIARGREGKYYCVQFTISECNWDFAMRINNRNSWLLCQCSAVVEYGSLQVPMPLLPALQGHTYSRLHGWTHWARGVGIILSGIWTNGKIIEVAVSNPCS